MRASLRSSKGHRGPSGSFGSSRHDRAHHKSGLSIFSHGFVYIPHLHIAALSFTLRVHVALSLCLHAPRNCRARRKLLGQFIDRVALNDYTTTACTNISCTENSLPLMHGRGREVSWRVLDIDLSARTIRHVAVRRGVASSACVV
jgi:hypothetical protein